MAMEGELSFPRSLESGLAIAKWAVTVGTGRTANSVRSSSASTNRCAALVRRRSDDEARALRRAGLASQFLPKSRAKESGFMELILGLQKDHGHGPALRGIRGA